MPGPLIFSGASITEHPGRWVGINMAMCIGIEGAIYHYRRLFGRPYVGSTVANVVSLIVGIPLALLSAFLADLVVPRSVVSGSAVPDLLFLFLLPTLLSIAVEFGVLKTFRRHEERPRHSMVWTVTGANVLTNVLMLIYLLELTMLKPWLRTAF